MKIVVIGGTGLIGSKTVAIPRGGSYDVVTREVVGDPEAPYWGGRVEERSLVPLGEARLGNITFDEWLRCSRAAA